MSNSRGATSAKNWKKRKGGEELVLPSGNTCMVKRPGMDKLLKAGIMPDSLTPIALENIQKSESGGRPTRKRDEEVENREMMEKLLGDKDAISDIFQAFDRVTAMVVTDPKVRVHWYTDEDEERGIIPKDFQVGDEILDEDRDEDDDVLYTDDVDDADKMFIFQFVVGGTRDLETFRAEYGEQLEALGAE